MIFQDQAEQFFKSGHTNNWAVLVCTSRFWFNYRHVANTLSVYRSVKRLGIPDSHIVLMLADDMACNPRNPKPATVFSHKNMELNVYGDDVEVDYRSYEVTVENFLRVLTGRIPPSTPRSKRLLSDDRSNILIYMTGHGGNGFLKFQDSEEITNVELADAFEQMWQKRRYNELLFIIDTCQGASMYERFYSPNIMALASSQVGEDSLSHQPDLGIGVHLMDRYTFYVLEFLEEIHPASQTNMNDLLLCDKLPRELGVIKEELSGYVYSHKFQVCPKSLCVSTPGHRTDLFQRDPQNVLITDFFGSVRKVEITMETISLDRDLAGFESNYFQLDVLQQLLCVPESLWIQFVKSIDRFLGDCSLNLCGRTGFENAFHGINMTKSFPNKRGSQWQYCEVFMGWCIRSTDHVPSWRSGVDPKVLEKSSTSPCAALVSQDSIQYALTRLPRDEVATEPLKYAEQLPVAQIIHQKPKQKDWHPPGGFILGLWALIIMVFFKTYGIKHMKHVF
ncbi:Pigk [Columba guinea]|nr:Pigk [Columba guinea]